MIIEISFNVDPWIGQVVGIGRCELLIVDIVLSFAAVVICTRIRVICALSLLVISKDSYSSTFETINVCSSVWWCERLLACNFLQQEIWSLTSAD